MGRAQTGSERGVSRPFHTAAPFGAYLQAMKRLAILGAVLAICAPAPAFSQQPRNGDDWYRGQLVELSEVLGGSHYLRILCEGRQDQRWRDYMRGVIQREPRYNAVLVEGFNRGYRQEEARFPVCDSNTRQMEAELRARGLRIAQGLSARHAPGAAHD